MASEGEITGAMERFGISREEAETVDYLGDGVYATFDGYHVWARTLEHEKIAFEPGLLQRFKDYEDRIRPSIIGQG